MAKKPLFEFVFCPGQISVTIKDRDTGIFCSVSKNIPIVQRHISYIIAYAYFFKIQWRLGEGSEECKQQWCPLYFIGRYIQEHIFDPPEMHIFFTGVDTEVYSCDGFVSHGQRFIENA